MSFTRSGTGGSPGSSNNVKKSKMPGGTMMTATGQDNVTGVNLSNELGGSFGGGDASLSHSLSGASAVQRQKGG